MMNCKHDCIPFDGSYCDCDTSDIPRFFTDLAVMEVGKVVNPQYLSAYYALYAHDYGETMGIYDELGQLTDVEGVSVFIPPVLIAEQMFMNVNEVKNYQQPKKRLVLLSKRVAHKETVWQAMAA